MLYVTYPPPITPPFDYGVATGLVFGSEDGGWPGDSTETAASLNEFERKAGLIVIEGEGHRMFATVPFVDLGRCLRRR